MSAVAFLGRPGSGRRVAVAAGEFVPIPVIEIDLGRPLVTIEPNRRGQVLVVCRIHGVPLGVLSLMEQRHLAQPELDDLLLDRFGRAVAAHLHNDGVQTTSTTWRGLADAAQRLRADACALRPRASTRLATVVICTLGAEERLPDAVESALAQTHAEMELIVVDNDPASGRVPAALRHVEDVRLRIVQEPRRGLSFARNAGLAAARGDIIAFTDDDATADPAWLAALIAPFDERRDVMCTTGLVLPAELNTKPQLLFEEFGGFDKGFERVVWSEDQSSRGRTALGRPGEGGTLFPYSCGVFGSGNNMAFRAGPLREQGGFDVALGAGSRARGGEDLDSFLAVILSGGVIVYEPRALIRHHARSAMAELRRQMYGYGTGMSAVIAKHFVAHPASAAQIARRMPAGISKLLAPGSAKNGRRRRDYPGSLTRLELAGYLTGPLLYLLSRRTARSGAGTIPTWREPITVRDADNDRALSSVS
jgi:glycosyltransferase involved in cell wall biosynthesis